jgi:hypothetical protein
VEKKTISLSMRFGMFIQFCKLVFPGFNLQIRFHSEKYLLSVIFVKVIKIHQTLANAINFLSSHEKKTCSFQTHSNKDLFLGKQKFATSIHLFSLASERGFKFDENSPKFCEPTKSKRPLREHILSLTISTEFIEE